MSIIKKGSILLDSIFCVGVHHSLSAQEIKRVIFVNQIALSFIGAAVPFVSVLSIFGYHRLTLIAYPAVVLYIACMLFNYQQQYNFAQTCVVTGIFVPAYLYAWLLGPGSGIQYVYFICISFSYALFSQYAPKTRMLLTALPIILFFVLHLQFYYLPTPVLMDPSHLRYIFFTAVSIIIVILFLTGKFYIQMADRYKNQSELLLKIYDLTEREGDIIERIVAGKTNKEIAKDLYIEEGTVKNHLNHIFQKTKVKNRLALLSMVMDRS